MKLDDTTAAESQSVVISSSRSLTLVALIDWVVLSRVQLQYPYPLFVTLAVTVAVSVPIMIAVPSRR